MTRGRARAFQPRGAIPVGPAARVKGPLGSAEPLGAIGAGAAIDFSSVHLAGHSWQRRRSAHSNLLVSRRQARQATPTSGMAMRVTFLSLPGRCLTHTLAFLSTPLTAIHPTRLRCAFHVPRARFPQPLQSHEHVRANPRSIRVPERARVRRIRDHVPEEPAPERQGIAARRAAFTRLDRVIPEPPPLNGPRDLLDRGERTSTSRLAQGALRPLQIPVDALQEFVVGEGGVAHTAFPRDPVGVRAFPELEAEVAAGKGLAERFNWNGGRMLQHGSGGGSR